ncbi:hypothetical protein CP8484711_1564 [Chlamydia psittaci 84-8471/1]|nr:hypothetical protein CP8484711_1564 [Chlamydia psittaci 84-8471/1]
MAILSAPRVDESHTHLILVLKLKCARLTKTMIAILLY